MGMKILLQRRLTFGLAVVLIGSIGGIYGQAGDGTPLASGTTAGQEWDGNGLKAKFCWCPDGMFTMGSPLDEKDRMVNEKPVQVTLTGFWLGKHEVTQSEWKSIMGTTVKEQSDKATFQKDLAGEGPKHPIYFVNYEDATNFCSKLTKQEREAGRLPTGWEYRLPTEAQWEYACRAGTTTRFASGNDEEDLKPYAWFDMNAEGTTHEVGTTKPNAWGICDMHGNVWEWCRDWYSSKLPGDRDPEVSLQSKDRVSRGGCCDSAAGRCRSSRRSASNPQYRVFDMGFRVAAVRLSK